MIMNLSAQHGSVNRRAELNPFAESSVEAEAARAASAGTVRRERAPSGTESESAYGCVDWYLYPHARGQPECRLARAAGTSLRRH
jgi:hypothetical protein